MSFFQNIFDKFFDKEEPKTKQNKGLLEYGDQLKNTDLDYKFAQLFTLSGGEFNYCANEAEALNILSQIISAERISSVFCCDEDLKKFLDITKTSHSQDIAPKKDAAFITCEYLIAYDARIMLSYNNILHYNSAHLPEKIIIIANVSQIVPNLSEAMTRIKRGDNIKNLTSISGANSDLYNPNKKYPKLFLLLLED